MFNLIKYDTDLYIQVRIEICMIARNLYMYDYLSLVMNKQNVHDFILDFGSKINLSIAGSWGQDLNVRFRLFCKSQVKYFSFDFQNTMYHFMYSFISSLMYAT